MLGFDGKPHKLFKIILFLCENTQQMPISYFFWTQSTMGEIAVVGFHYEKELLYRE